MKNTRQPTQDYRLGTLAAIETLTKNLERPTFQSESRPVKIEGKLQQINESEYSDAHLLRENEGWEAPHADIVNIYLDKLKQFDSAYSDAKIAEMFGFQSDRRIREFRSGAKDVPYGVWRRFLQQIGKIPPEVVDVIAFIR